jgi:threonyl-tRNA synthetase
MSAAPVSITLPDGSTRSYAPGTTIRQVAESIGKRLGKDAIGGVIDDGRIIDVHTPLPADCRLRIVTVGSVEGLEVLRHSAAHLLATAVVRLYPGAQVTIGPAIETGFYYDFEKEGGFTPDDLARIEATMHQIAKADLPFVREEVSREAAMELFGRLGESYKVQLIEAIPQGETISLYRLGDWVDLCRGPHVPSTKHLKAFRLTHVAGAYWRGDENNPMLARIYGTAFWQQAELDAHFAMIEAARARDHRKIGQALDLFSFNPIAPAMPFFHAKGATVYTLLEGMVRGYYKALGFDEVITPQIVDTELFARSGHLANYRENMFFTQVDEREFGVKPMNCPGHTLIFAERKRSYRDLPLRMADFGRLHRYERSGVTAGLTRVRSFCQDDAHIFCREDQVAFEIETQIRMVQEIIGHFGFEMRINFSTRPKMSLGREPGLSDAERAEWDAIWERAERTLEGAIEAAGLTYQVNAGDGAFYGPKIDGQVKDAIGRWHQLSTIQLDFGLPKRFDLGYTAQNGAEARPVMVHRAVLGSLERFIGILIEHTAGDFPLWLAPVQVGVVTINDRLLGYGRKVQQAFEQAGLRATLDTRSEKLGAKIRELELGKVPIIAVVGQKEADANTVSLRWRKKGDQGALVLDQAVGDVLMAATVPSPGAPLVRRMAQAWEQNFLPQDP